MLFITCTKNVGILTGLFRVTLDSSSVTFNFSWGKGAVRCGKQLCLVVRPLAPTASEAGNAAEEDEQEEEEEEDDGNADDDTMSTPSAMTDLEDLGEVPFCVGRFVQRLRGTAV